MRIKLEDDKMCFVCGKDNPSGLKMHFEHPKQGHLLGSVTFLKTHQGYKNIVHGGMMATVLDEMMVNLAWIENKPVVTAEFNMRLKNPAKIGEKIFFESHILRENKKLLYASAIAKDAHGLELASATASCVFVDVKTLNQ